MRVAIVGCGFAADYYLSTLPNYPELQLVGVLDRDPERTARFARFWKVPLTYRTLNELLSDARVEMVLNLTNPRSHFEVSRACLLADKHVYSEKPLAMAFSDAEDLVTLAENRGLYLTSAPCSVLGDTAQTVWKALRLEEIGKVRLVYAELDDGLIHRMRYRKWTNPSGGSWPFKDEFEVGCTIEHAGYYVTWLTAFFGPASNVTASASCLIPDKAEGLEIISPDFSVATIEFASGVVARLTCSIVASHDHSLRVFGDEGVISVAECWDYTSPVYVSRRTRLRSLAAKYKLLRAVPGIVAQRYPLARPANFRGRYAPSNRMDFARGVAELAAAIRESRPSRMSARHALHVNEIVLAIQHPHEMGCPRAVKSTFAPMEPMPWAQ